MNKYLTTILGAIGLVAGLRLVNYRINIRTFWNLHTLR